MAVRLHRGGMSRLLYASILVLAGLAEPAVAQDLLPPSFSGWTAPAAAQQFGADALEALTGDDAPILREYGTLGAERRVYSRGPDTLSVTLYRMRDTSAAYGVYTYFRTDQMAPARLTPYSSASAPRVLVLQGNLLLDIAGKNLPSIAPDLKTLVASVIAHSDEAPYPTLGQYLPTQGLVRHSERYILGPLALDKAIPVSLGDWIGFGDAAEAALARYRLNGEEIILLLVAYPTPQAAAHKFERIGRRFALNSSGGLAAGRHPPLFARRLSSLLAVVAETRSSALANSLLNQIHYANQVTWNEPGHRATEPSYAEMIIGTIVGTGIFLFIALLAGIGFGGVRLIVKHFFPGKVFDRAAHVEILQLGLSSKPIEAKDFY